MLNILHPDHQDNRDKLVEFIKDTTPLDITPFREKYSTDPKSPGVATGYSVCGPAIDTTTLEKVWIKFPLDAPHAIQTFQREAAMHGKLLLGIRHPHLLPIREFTTDPELGIGIVTPFMENGDLMRFIEGIKPDEPNHLRIVVNVIIQICKALQALERHGIYHYDLKPQNIFIDQNRKGKKKMFVKIRLGDFGLSRPAEYMQIRKTRHEISSTMHETLPEIWGNTRNTPTRLVYGTPAYMSPERFSSAHDIDMAKSELFTIGLIAFELITKRHPHLNKNRDLPEPYILRERMISGKSHLEPNPYKSSNVPMQTEKAIHAIVQSLLQGRTYNRGRYYNQGRYHEIKSFEDLIAALSNLDWSNGPHPNPPKYNQLPNYR